MIRYAVGDMFKADADCLVNTVNCEGYMGKGIAYQFKLRFPLNNQDYIKACRNGRLFVGTVHYYMEDGKTIINFPTKDKWRAPSKMEYIEKGLDAMLEILPDLGVNTVAIPPLGCGNGGLEWDKVKRLIEEKLHDYQNQFEFLIFEPSKNYVQTPAAPPRLSVSSLIIMQIKMKLNKCTKLRLQKTGYFMNIFSGESYFDFKKHKYGPYAYSIDIISRKIGEYQQYYGVKDTKTTFEMVHRVICSDKTEKTYDHFLPAIIRAADYVNEIEDNAELECISTVLYLIEEGQNHSEEQIVSGFKEWSADKANRFSEKEILKSIEYLEKTGITAIDSAGNYHINETVSLMENAAKGSENVHPDK